MLEKGKFKGCNFKNGQTDFIKKKIERFKLGLPIECKKHGLHVKWRLHTANNVQCKMCGNMWQMAQRRRNPLRFIYRDAKKHAESRSREFSITLENLVEINNNQENKCALTGIDFDDNNPKSLDRINSELGYTIDNIQLILVCVNRMKSNMDENEFIGICGKISAYSEKRQAQKKRK